MRYVFLFQVLLVAAVIAIGGFRGMKSEKPPIMIFNDMDQQAKIKAQKPSGFFADGMGTRMPPAHTVPVGFDIPAKALADGANPGPGFSTLSTAYYNTGKFGDYFGAGMPKELELTEANAAGFLRRGQDRYNIYCAVCHGESGNGQGVVAKAGFANVRNLHDPLVQPDKAADGSIFNTITHGKGLMGSYGDKLTVNDRWAVIAWVRVLQKSASGVPATEPGVKALLEKIPAAAATAPTH